MKTISQIAGDIFTNEFDGISGAPTSGVIDSWLTANVGRLNVLINTSFEEGSELDNEAAAIYYSIYMAEYFNKQSQNALRGISTSLGVLSIKEGDSAITFTNKNEVAKTWKTYAAGYATDVGILVAKYNIYQSYPRQVYGNDAHPPHLIPEQELSEIREIR